MRKREYERKREAEKRDRVNERKKERAHGREEGREMKITINHKLLLIVRDVRASAIETYGKKEREIGERKKEREKKEREGERREKKYLVSDENVMRREDAERI